MLVGIRSAIPSCSPSRARLAGCSSHGTALAEFGDQFGLILLLRTRPERIAALPRRSAATVRAPVAVADREIFLTASIGVAIFDPQTRTKARGA